jgi:hypothetical protein
MYLTFLFELCLLGLASFLGLLFALEFLEILFQRGRMWDQSKLVVPKWEEASYVNIGREDQKGRKVNFCKFILALVVLS